MEVAHQSQIDSLVKIIKQSNMETESEARRGILTLAESDHILRKHLDPVHYNDQRVITFIRSYLMEYSVQTAARDAMLPVSRCYDLRKSPDIDAAMRALEAKSVSGANFKASSLVRRMEEIVDANIMDIINPDNTCKSKEQLPVHLQKVIKKFKVKTEWEIVKDMNGIPTGTKLKLSEITDVELYDAMKAAELLARDHGIFREVKVHQHEVGKNAAAILLGSAEQRAIAHVSQMKDVTPVVQEPAVNNNRSVMPELIDD